MRLIYPAWCATTLDGKKTIGSPYTLALARDIHVPDVQHCSANDVEAIRSLLSETYASESAIRRSLIDPEAKLLTKEEYKKIKKAANHTNILYLDPETWILHDKACPDIAGRTDLIGLSSYKEAIKKRPQPCICCHENYIVENWKLSSKSIRNCHFKFIYSERGGLFHNLDCILTRQIPYMDLKGTAYYEKCITKGFQPCRYCKPTFSDQVFQFDETRNSNYISQGKWHTTRLLKREEVVALHRQEIALKERIALSKTAKLKTETEIRDEHVLTRSGYAFWAASGYQTFHLRSCPKLDHISGLNGFAKYTDALRAGFTACKLCKPSSKYDILISVPIYHQERQGETIDTLNRLCDEYGFQHRFESRYYYIDTPVGKWQIKVYTRPVDVYHINSSANPDTIHYHKQKRLFLSLTDTFEYIKRHDLSLMKKVGKECVNISKISSN